MLIDGEIFRDGSCVGYLTQMSIGFSSLLATHTTSISASAETATPKSLSISRCSGQQQSWQFFESYLATDPLEKCRVTLW
jgi:hypothetical protein